jgi:NADH:ubiquinone oxidoreductase subunit 3 (subunit A)
VANSLYFVIFIMIGSFFFLNFFIGVLFLKYNQAQKEEQKGFSSQDLGWMDIQRLILSSNPEYETTNVPSSAWRRQFHTLVSSDRFDMIIMSCIIMNMVQMALYYEGMHARISNVLDFSNYIFTGIFIIEAGCKIIAFGGSYLKNSWNKFDFS